MSEQQDDKYSVMQAVAQTIAGQPVEFEKTINGLLAKKVEVAVDAKREEVGNSLFGPPEADEPEEAQEQETDESTEVEDVEQEQEEVSATET